MVRIKNAIFCVLIVVYFWIYLSFRIIMIAILQQGYRNTVIWVYKIKINTVLVHVFLNESSILAFLKELISARWLAM